MALTLCLAFGPGGAVVGPAVAQVYGSQGQSANVNPFALGSTSSSTSGESSQTGASTGQATSSPFANLGPAYTATQLQPQPAQTTQLQDASGFASMSSQTDPAIVRLANLISSESKSPKTVAPPSEFQNFVEKELGKPLPRFGASLLTDDSRGFTPPPTTTVPPDYELNPGDEIIVHATGSLEGDIHLVIDNDGRVFLPHVGAIDLAGVRYGDVQALMTRRVGEQYRNFKIAITIGQLHAITVYVTGFAASPGTYTLSSLSTLVNAVLASGGPGSGGSFRSVQLRRAGQLVTDFDLYDLLLRGDKSHDTTLQNDDVIFIPPVGPEVAISGSVNAEAIYEAKAGETLGDLLKDSGGLSSLADPSTAYVSRLTNLGKMGWEQIDLAQASTAPILAGDILRVTSVADFARPQERQAIIVKLEGEVDHPGRYYLPPNSTIADLLAQAGGLSSNAFVYGAELDRVTVRQQQQAGFDQAIDNIEFSIAASPLSLSGIDAAAAGSQVGRAQIARQLVEQMKSHKPDGRMVLPLAPDSKALPANLTLENDDRIYVPPPPTTVGVFGAIYEPGSFLYVSGKTLGDYLKLAGGPQRLAEQHDIFVVRANGSVLSRRETGFGHSFDDERALPGDVIFMPIKTEPSLLWDRIVQATTVLYNFGLGAAAIKVLTQ